MMMREVSSCDYRLDNQGMAGRRDYERRRRWGGRSDANDLIFFNFDKVRDPLCKDVGKVCRIIDLAVSIIDSFFLNTHDDLQP